MTSLIYKDAKSHKFWTIEISGSSTTVTYGKVGTSGQTSSKDHGSTEKAKKFMASKIAQQMRKGYAKGGKVTSKASSKRKVGPKVAKSRGRSRSRSVKTKAAKGKKPAGKGKKSGKKGGKAAKLTKKCLRSLSKSKSKLGKDEKASLVFKSKDLKNNKYWKISRKDKSTTVSFGRMGHKARKKTKEHSNIAASKAFFQKMVSQKTKKGYVSYNEDSLTDE